MQGGRGGGRSGVRRAGGQLPAVVARNGTGRAWWRATLAADGPGANGWREHHSALVGLSPIPVCIELVEMLRFLARRKDSASTSSARTV
ncbi:hypothetical protein SPHINGOAX6_70346 [Sphingomonas sp. AX6]|nr:hypothetical protein SPHINGOAX6_70346 [Sphingomonas sp. AX6]